MGAARLKNTRIPMLLGAVALYPLWFLYTNNLATIRLLDLLRPLLLSLALVGLAYGLLAGALITLAILRARRFEYGCPVA